MVKNFYRKVAFGLSLQDEVPQDPLKWAFNQLDQVPLFSWEGTIFLKKKCEKSLVNSFMETEKLRQQVFWGEDLQNYSEKLFKI